MTSPTLSRADELVNIGVGFHNQGKADEARLHYAGALIADPFHRTAHCNLSALMLNAGKAPVSAATSRRGLALYPEDLELRANYGAALMNLGRQLECRNELEHVLALNPKLYGVWHNLGLSHYIDNSFHRAEVAFRKCIEGMPDYVHCLSDLGLCLLAQGRIPEGLDVYEIRWRLLHRSKVWTLDDLDEVPEWKGEDLEEKTILVHHEQGFGDSLMLGRFILDLKSRAKRVVYAGPDELLGLFQESFDIASLHWDDLENMRGVGADFHSPLLSVMYHLGYKSPEEIDKAPKKYLKLGPNAPPAPSLPPAPLKIGICWASGNHGPLLEGRRRYVPLELFLSLTENPAISVVSLQLGAPQSDILALGAESLIFDPMPKVSDFSDSAAIVSQLDLVISVDSAVCHLSGALGIPTLMIAPMTRCWRWWGTGKGTGWPWYEDFRIFPQTEMGDWKRPVRNALREVDRFIAKKMLLKQKEAA